MVMDALESLNVCFFLIGFFFFHLEIMGSHLDQ